MRKVSQVVKADMIDFAPNLGGMGPDKVVAASGILTMRNRDFREMLGKVGEKTLKGFHNEATRRGHASLTTSVNFYFWLEGSRMIDFYFSSFPFGSYMIFSSRRIEIGMEHMVVPDSIMDSAFKDEYERVCKRLVELYHKVKAESTIDNARRILPIGFVSRGLFNMPLQVILGIIKEVREDEKRSEPALPKEIGRIAAVLEDRIKNNASYLADASLGIPYNTNFAHPNLFRSDVELKPPQMKILLKDEKLESLVAEAKNKLNKLNSKERMAEAAAVWKEFVENAQDKILLELKIVGSLSIWNDLKRHRTIRQKVEPIYAAVQRSLRAWDEKNFCIPTTKSPELRQEVVDAYKEALALYAKMTAAGIKKRDAVYIIPHGINLGVTMLLDGYHLFDPFGFFGVRACTHNDYETVVLINKIINNLEKDIPVLEKLMGAKCKLGYCPEKNFCAVIKQFVKDYDEKTHAAFQ